jgi:transketolase
MAIGLRRRGLDAQTFVLLGDGELQEGQNWEAIPLAAKYGLGNLTAIVDRNGMQQYGWPLPSGETNRGDRRDPWAGSDLPAAFRAFGWRVLEIDGHDFGAIVAACADALAAGTDGGSTPTVILATTVKGRGFTLTEGISEWHSRVATLAEAATARAEQEGTHEEAGL